MDGRKFDDGIKFGMLANKIRDIGAEIEKINLKTRKNLLKEIIKKAFPKYLYLAKKYEVEQSEIKKITKIYQKYIVLD